MKILVVHSRYKERGGEDVVYEQEVALLRRCGVNVATFEISNDLVDGMGVLELSRSLLWNTKSAEQLRERLKDQYDLVHVHNFFPVLSPAIFHVCRSLNVPVVLTLHNYRLMCANAILYDGHGICEQCVGRNIPVPAITKSCYRNNRIASVGVVTMQVLHRLIGTWGKVINSFIVLTDFAKHKYIEAGFAEEKIYVKPNFVERRNLLERKIGDYALFVGRLVDEKGIAWLLDCWKRLNKKLPLVIIGDGPLKDRVVEFSSEHDEVIWLGQVDREKVFELMAACRFLVFPSIWYEGFPMTIVEAMSLGVPVVATNVGAMASIIEHGRNGFLFDMLENDQFINLIDNLTIHMIEAAGCGALKTYFDKYTPERNFEYLIRIYEDVCARHNMTRC